MARIQVLPDLGNEASQTVRPGPEARWAAAVSARFGVRNATASSTDSPGFAATACGTEWATASPDGTTG